MKKAGAGAKFLKYDISDAYKLIPGDPAHWRMFGFKWLGRWFFEKTAVFGSTAAPAHFDNLPETVVNIACAKTGFPKEWVHRQLDDVPVVGPSGSGLVEKLGTAYRRFARI